MRLRQLVATGLVVSMVMGSSVMALAENKSETTGGGSGTLEGIVDTKTFKIDLPTVSTNTFDYISDPQGLIAKTEEAAHANKTFGEGSIFFTNTASDKKYDYSNESDKLKAVNKSSQNIKLTVKATSTEATGDKKATLAASSDLSSATSAQVYLALTDGDKETKTLVSGDSGVEITQVLGAAPEAAYEYKYEGGAYKYELKSDISAYNFAEYSVYLTGAASEKGWEDTTTLPSVSVVWTAVPAGDSDSVTVATPDQTPAAPAADLTVNAATATGTWDRTSEYKIAVDDSLVSDLSDGDVGIQYNGSVYAYTGVYNGNKTLATNSLISIDGNVITLNTAVANYIPVGSTLYIIDSSKNIVSRITIN